MADYPPCALCGAEIDPPRQIVGRMKGSPPDQWQLEFAVYRNRTECATGRLCDKCQIDIFMTGEDIHPSADLDIKGNHPSREK